jgi:hypothetical protein
MQTKQKINSMLLLVCVVLLQHPQKNESYFDGSRQIARLGRGLTFDLFSIARPFSSLGRRVDKVCP